MRRTSRENAFKLIFEKFVSGGTGEISYAVLVRSMTEDERDYFDVLVREIEIKKDFLTGVIGRYAHGYEIDRVYKIDLSILLISVYEILFGDDVPVKVAINEALEMSKKYSTDNSPTFINGILASVVRNKEELKNEYENN